MTIEELLKAADCYKQTELGWVLPGNPGEVNLDAICTLIAAMAEELRKYQWRPIAEAPRDGMPILVNAKWDWDDMNSPSEEYYTQVATCATGSEEFWSVSSNPYSDVAVDIQGWMPAPTPPEAKEEGE